MKSPQYNTKNFLVGFMIAGLFIICIAGLINRAQQIQSRRNQTSLLQPTEQIATPTTTATEVSTKQVVDMPDDVPCEWITKDQKQVYYGETPINQADPATFRIIGYWMDGFESAPVCIGVDKNHVYANTKMLPDLDPKTTKLLMPLYVKDKNTAYYVNGNIIKMPTTIDLATFTGTEDKNTLYGCGQAIAPNTPTTKILGDFYGRAGNKIYYKNNILPDADAKTFSVIHGNGVFACESSWGGYAIDNKNAYYDGKKIPNADIKSFKTTDEIGVTYDKNAEYVQGTKIKSEFQSCSSDPKNLPGGKANWLTKLPILNSTSTKIEFCLTPNKDILVKYVTNEEERLQNIDLFTEKGQLLRTKEITCPATDTNFPFSLRSLDGSTVTISCLEGEACGNRAFYQFNLNDWKSTNILNLQRTQEIYDCGYRG